MNKRAPKVYNRRYPDTSVYEELKIRKRGKRNEYYLNFDHLDGWYTCAEIIRLNICGLTTSALLKRIANLINKEGKFYTIKSIIKTRRNVNKRGSGEYKKVVISDLSYAKNSEFTKVMKLFIPREHPERIMQSYEIGEQNDEYTN